MEVTGIFGFASAKIDGETLASAPILACQWLGPEAAQNGYFSITGAELVVNITTTDRYRIGFKPDKPDQNQGELGKEPPVYSEARYHNFSATSRDFLGAANALLNATADRAALESTSRSEVFLHASLDEVWRGGSDPKIVQAGSEFPTNRRYETEAGFPQWDATGANLTVQGDFRWTFWNATLDVRSAGQAHEFRSGTWILNETPTAGGIHPAAREVRVQLVELRVVGGTLHFAADAGTTRFFAPTASFAGHGTGKFTETRGLLEVDRKTRPLHNATISYTGGFQIQSAAGDTSDRIQADLALSSAAVNLIGEAGATTEDSVSQRQQPLQRIVRLDHLGGLVAFGLAILAASPLAIILAIKYPRATFEKAEAALLQDQPRKAVRITRRLLAKDPKDADVLFLHGAGLFQSGQTRRVVDEIDAVARTLPPKKRLGLALLLSLAHAHEENHVEAERWAREVGRSPDYRSRLGPYGGKFSELTRHWDEPMAGYA